MGPVSWKVSPGLQLGDLVSALADDLIQELNGLGLRLPLVHADGAGQEGSLIGTPGTQGKELPGVGGMLPVRPEGTQQPDVRQR